MRRHDLLIVGAGPVGLALALALKDAGLDIALADSRPQGAAAADPRILALAHGTGLTLDRLGVWGALAPAATPIRTIHISQQGGLGRSVLQADDYALPALGHVLGAGTLAAALESAVAAAGIPVLYETTVRDFSSAPGEVTASLEGLHGGPCQARLVACAEGAMQEDREPGIRVRDYRQHAVITLATPREPHRGIAFERFTARGPLALLPCGTRYAVVHTANPEQAEALLGLADADYLATLQAAIGARVTLTTVAPRLRYPLLLRVRRTPVGPRTVWLGNAAQTLHPVAGQGFNLALRDVWALARTVLQAGGDPGAPATLDAYAASRRLDRYGTIGFTDMLVRLFSNDVGPLRHARGAGLLALDLFPPLRHFVAKRMMFGARAWP